ncbi:MAG: 4Fe-4S dicluster domain-containing protein [Candidatus Zixiibacteriota bacterium]|nr:MAG: 4Fe-4S dicluster domain-containing protein [candidate division Zixibacteria bacterium]
MGCQACASACKEANALPGEKEEELSATAYTVVKEKEDVYYRRLCMHCSDPTCASVCPVRAFEKTEEGAVVYNPKKCMGCRYCIQACPFGVPTYEWKKRNPLVRKCTMCIQRQRKGDTPACAVACPTEATIFWDRDELIKGARKRIEANPGLYVNHIYGEKEAGGTSVLLLSSVPFEKLGFPTDLSEESLPSLTRQVTSKIPNFVVVSGVLLYGIYWIINRRMELAELGSESKDQGTSEENDRDDMKR